MAQNAFIVLLLLMQPLLLRALTVSVSGATSSSQDVTTPSKIIVNAGYALPGACVEKNGTTPCNSCVGNSIEDNASSATIPAPCNENGIYDGLTFSVTIDSDKADINALAVGVSKSSVYSGNAITTFTKPAVNGRTYTVSATWTQIAAALGFDLTCSASTGCAGTVSFYFGPIKDDAFVEYMSVEIHYNIINYTSRTDPKNGLVKALANMCPPNNFNPLGSDLASKGLCYFEMFPGDGKAYITNLINGWAATAIDPDGSQNYTNLVMYYVEKSGAATSLQTLKTIKNNSPKAKIGITTTDGDPLAEYKVGGLENGVEGSTRTYCFLPAIQDQTGNILYFLDVQNLVSTRQFTTEQFDKMCASPSEVVGILSDKDCFIATVAFGKRDHIFLNILREFRNKFLHPFSGGKKFIKFYYKNGPEWAKYIGGRPWAKALVKAALLPVVGFVYLMLNPIWLLGFALLGALVLLKFKGRGRI